MNVFNEFSGKVAVITGAGSGIGQALAKQLAASGAILVLADVNKRGLEDTVSLLPSAASASIYLLDVSDRAAYQRFVQQVIDDHQQVDVVINNAGIVRLHSMELGSYEDYEKSFDVNVWGVIYGCKEFLPYLKQRPKAWLANVSSGAGLIGIAKYTSYNTAKFAVRGLTEALRNELRDTPIVVSCVYPGGVNTNIQSSGVHSADAMESAKKLASAMEQMSPDEAAYTILAGMVKGKKRILVGRDIKILDILARLLPSAYDRFVARYV